MKSWVVGIGSLAIVSCSFSEARMSGSTAFDRLVSETAVKAWNDRIVPELPTSDPGKPGAISWGPRVSPPFPTEWPSSDIFRFYVHARGQRLGLRDAEVLGPVWAEITLDFSANEKPIPKIAYVPNKITEEGTQGVRPLTADEAQWVKVGALNLLRAVRGPKIDSQLRAYYCLQLSLGNIPEVARKNHSPFFGWLGCR